MSYEPITTIQISYTFDRQPYRDTRTTYIITSNRTLTEEKALAILQAANGKTYPRKENRPHQFATFVESVAVDPDGEKATVVINEPFND